MFKSSHLICYVLLMFARGPHTLVEFEPEPVAEALTETSKLKSTSNLRSIDPNIICYFCYLFLLSSPMFGFS